MIYTSLKQQNSKLMHQFTHKKLLDKFCKYFTHPNDIFIYSTRNFTKNSLYFPQFFTNTTQRWGMSYCFKQIFFLNSNFFYKRYFPEKY